LAAETGTAGTVRKRAWTAILAAGIALRALAAFPPFRSPLQSDGTMTGLTALEILHGHLRVFLFHGVRLGALESYLHVPAFLLFGATRGALYIAPFLAGSAVLVAYAFFARELLGEREGLVALLLFALPPPMVLLWNVLPFGYAETLLCTTVALAAAVRIANRGASRGMLLLFGLAVGVGWWCSALSLMGTLPAALWIALRRPAVLRSPRALGLAAAGLAVGALPWIAINLRYPLISFQGGSEWQSNFAFRSAGGWGQYLANAGRLAHRVPSLLLRADGPRPAFFGPLVVAVGVVYGAAFGAALWRVGRKDQKDSKDQKDLKDGKGLMLPLLVAACTGLFFVASAAGGVEGETVRYVLPAGLAAPLLLAGLWGRLSRFGRAGSAAGDALLVLVLVVNASGYCLPGSPRRTLEQWQARSEDHLLYLLGQRRIAWVFGGYWDVYSLNFLSGERIKAVPDWSWADYHGYERSLGAAPAPLALVSRHRGQVAAWARRAGLRGELVDVNDTFEAFFPAPDPPTAESPAALIARLREAEKPEPLPPAACRARLEVLDGAPAAVESGGRQVVRLRVTHVGSGEPWTSAADLPGPAQAVRIGVRWFLGETLMADQRVELPRSLDPGESVKVEVPLLARGAHGSDTEALPPGRYRVRIGLVQELVQWFPEDGGAGVAMEVEVR
jgi:4-amino-4-deoxy-L-arabinose transferase-like glycosyltransferase